MSLSQTRIEAQFTAPHNLRSKVSRPTFESPIELAGKTVSQLRRKSQKYVNIPTLYVWETGDQPLSYLEAPLEKGKC